jgi:hypothetical protein
MKKVLGTVNIQAINMRASRFPLRGVKEYISKRGVKSRKLLKTKELVLK